LVEVQSQGKSVWLGPGSDWGCDGDAPSAQSRAKATDGARRAARVRAQAKSVERPESVSEPVLAEPEAVHAGTLAAETLLLADALRAERQGLPERARSLFMRLVADYPASPLAPEAKAGLARVR
jgi:hypothetical protein